MKFLFLYILFLTFLSCEKGEQLFNETNGNVGDVNKLFKNSSDGANYSLYCEVEQTKSLPKHSISGFLGDLSNLTCGTHCPLSGDNFFEQSSYEKEYGYLAFNNFTEWEGLSLKGQCRGHTIMTQKFNSLGVYCNIDGNLDCSKDNSLPCKRKRVCEADNNFKRGKNCSPNNLSSYCKVFYKKIISDIKKGKMRSIPGFTSLAQFSSHPLFYGNFKDAVSSYTANHKFGPAKTISSSSSSILNNLNDLDRRLQKNFTPYIGISGDGLGGHAVSVYEKKGNRYCIRDSNAARIINGAAVKNDCQHYIINQGGRIIYHTDLKDVLLSQLDLYADEDSRSINYAKQYQKTCEQIKENNNECVMDDSSHGVTTSFNI